MKVIATAMTILKTDFGYFGDTPFIPGNSSFCILHVLKYFIHRFTFINQNENHKIPSICIVSRVLAYILSS